MTAARRLAQWAGATRRRKPGSGPPNFQNNSLAKIRNRAINTDRQKRSRGAARQEGRGEEFLFGIGCNPLISPDSDE
jgi:hypothetical protein